MTKKEALEKLKKNKILTHSNFLPHEWIRQNGDKIIFENAVETDLDIFMGYRSTPNWEKGWTVFSEPKVGMKYNLLSTLTKPQLTHIGNLLKIRVY